MDISSKAMIVLVVITLLPVVALGSLFTMDSTQILTDDALGDTFEEVSIVADRVDLFLSDLEGDVLFLSRMADLQTFINVTNQSYDPVLREQIESDYVEYASSHLIYYQIRYINELGHEVIRVDDVDGGIFAIDEELLQNKSDRYYFQDAMVLGEGEVFVSPLDLNVEGESIENRGTESDPIYVPVIRYATPVFDEVGNPRGIVILNVYAQYFLDFFEVEESADTLFLVNEEGYYLHHPDEEKQWGWMLGTDASFIDEYPHLYSEVFSGVSGQCDHEDSIVSFYQISVGDSFWVVMSMVEKAVLYQSVSKIRQEVVMFSVVVVVLALLFGLALSRFVLRPLRQMTLFADELSAGNLDVRLPEGLVERKDEVGRVAAAFVKLIGNAKMGLDKYIDQKFKK